MELTQKQELYISRYMRDVSHALVGKLTDRQSERALSRLRARILDKIGGGTDRLPGDEEVLETLRSMGPPESQAAILVRVWGGPDASATLPPESEEAPTPAPSADRASPIPQPASGETAPVKQAASTALPLETETPAVWLGVCRYVAAASNLPLWMIRTLFAVIGLAVLPLALMAYTGAFFWMRASGRLHSPPLHPVRMVAYPTLTALVAVVAHLVGLYAVRGITFVHVAYIKRSLPDMDEWAWYVSESGLLLFWALFVLMPVSLLAALPLANGWDFSLKRFTQAGLALYAVIVSFGVASYVTGIIVAFVREFTG